MSCTNLCAKRKYKSSMGRINYKKRYKCTVCGIKIPHDEAITIRDHRLRCPCCHAMLRTHSPTGKTSRS